MVDLGAHPPYHPPPEGYRGGGGSDSSSDADSSMTSGSTSGSASGSSTSSGSTVTPPQAPGGLVDTHPAHQSHADIRNRNLNRSAIFVFAKYPLQLGKSANIFCFVKLPKRTFVFIYVKSCLFSVENGYPTPSSIGGPGGTPVKHLSTFNNNNLQPSNNLNNNISNTSPGTTENNKPAPLNGILKRPPPGSRQGSGPRMMSDQVNAMVAESERYLHDEPKQQPHHNLTIRGATAAFEASNGSGDSRQIDSYEV